jgi:Synaptobrevin
MLNSHSFRPMTQAERDNWTPAVHALREAGARDSAALERERHGALMEEARELEQQQAAEKEELLRGAVRTGGARRSSWMDVAGAAIAGLDQEKLHQPDNHDAVGTVKGAAQQAHFHMRDGMNAINERGNKINQLSEKTNDLENNAGEYKDLAAQVRKKLEKQNKGLNFLNPFAR